jgi:hypothetical protein
LPGRAEERFITKELNFLRSAGNEDYWATRGQRGISLHQAIGESRHRQNDEPIRYEGWLCINGDGAVAILQMRPVSCVSFPRGGFPCLVIYLIMRASVFK